MAKPPSFEALSVQRSVTAPPRVTEALRSEGGAGATGTASTVITTEVDPVPPWLSVTVSVAV